MTATEADYVIVGAGSAGCVLADRLSADGRNRVLVLEYGGSDRSIWIQMPSALSIPMNMARYNWAYETEPEPHLGGRRLHTPRGKVLGGSSSINGLVYIRGHAMDYERWQSHGAQGWAYADVLPYFRRAEARAEGGDETQEKRCDRAWQKAGHGRHWMSSFSAEVALTGETGMPNLAAAAMPCP